MPINKLLMNIKFLSVVCAVFHDFSVNASYNIYIVWLYVDISSLSAFLNTVRNNKQYFSPDFISDRITIYI